MKTYHEAYVEAYGKCQKARDAGRRFIEIRPWHESYRLYAHKKYTGFNVIQWKSGSICDWATNIAARIASAGLCEPQETQ